MYFTHFGFPYYFNNYLIYSKTQQKPSLVFGVRKFFAISLGTFCGDESILNVNPYEL